MTSLIINNWGWQQLKGFEDVTYLNNEDERRAQAVYYFLDLLKDRGLDPLAQACGVVEVVKTRCKEQGKELSEAEILKFLRAECELVYFVYALGRQEIPAESLSGDEDI